MSGLLDLSCRAEGGTKQLLWQRDDDVNEGANDDGDGPINMEEHATTILHNPARLGILNLQEATQALSNRIIQIVDEKISSKQRYLEGNAPVYCTTDCTVVTVWYSTMYSTTSNKFIYCNSAKLNQILNQILMIPKTIQYSTTCSTVQ